MVRCAFPDRPLVRALCASSTFVSAGPSLLVLAAQTVLYPQGYRLAADSALPLIVVPLLFWSLVVSHAGARQRFMLRSGAALWWFLLFPALWYVLAMGGVGALYFFLNGGAST